MERKRSSWRVWENGWTAVYPNTRGRGRLWVRYREDSSWGPALLKKKDDATEELWGRRGLRGNTGGAHKATGTERVSGKAELSTKRFVKNKHGKGKL